MRHRPAERTFFFAPLDINMNPLMVAGHVGELIDFFLRHVNRLAPRAELLADLFGERRYIVKFDRLHRRSSLLFLDCNPNPEGFHGSSRLGFRNATKRNTGRRVTQQCWKNYFVESNELAFRTILMARNFDRSWTEGNLRRTT